MMHRNNWRLEEISGSQDLDRYYLQDLPNANKLLYLKT